MKKNTMMRVASVLLVAVLLSTSVISGTFAKYVTSDSGSDTARVAKWGVTAVVSGDLFGADYVAGSGDATKGIISATYTGSADSAKAANGAKIVAPGTNSDQGVTISISGTPEVKNTVTFDSTAANNKDIYLKGGNYGTMVRVTGITEDNFGAGTYYTVANGTYTKAVNFSGTAEYYEVHDTVQFTADYYPIVWTVTGVVANSPQTYTTVSAMATALAGFNGTNDSLDPIDKSCTISWAWAFENNNGADTILGNIIAADSHAVPVKTDDNGDTYKTLTATTDYSTEVAFNYTITVTQVD